MWPINKQKQKATYNNIANKDVTVVPIEKDDGKNYKQDKRRKARAKFDFFFF